MEDKKPYISVVIPAYNEEKYIGATLKSVISQDYAQENYEVIVVDNNSEDKTAQVAGSFKVKVVECRTKGVSAARQAGVEVSRGEIIVFTDADTQVPKDWLTRVGKQFEDKEIAAITGTAEFDRAGRVNSLLAKGFPAFMRLQFIFGRKALNGFNCAIRKSVFAKIGGFNTNLVSAEDVDLGIRASKEGKVVFVPEIKVYTSARRMEKSRLGFFWQHFKNIVQFTILGKKPGKFDTIR